MRQLHGRQASTKNLVRRPAPMLCRTVLTQNELLLTATGTPANPPRVSCAWHVYLSAPRLRARVRGIRTQRAVLHLI